MKYFNTIFLLQLSMICSFAQDASNVIPAFENLSNFPNVRDFTMSASGNEAYVTLQSPLEEISIIAKMIKTNNNWGEPQKVSFSGQYKDLEPFLSPDGLKLLFVSNRPLQKTETKIKDFDIWMVERSTLNGKWSEPLNLGTPINSAANEFYPAISSNNNLYFTTDAEGSKGLDDIFFSKWHNGNYEKPESLSDSINSEGYEYNAYISPDETFLLFGAYARSDGNGSGDIYVSYCDSEGVWSRAKNLGSEINSVSMDYCPFWDGETNMLYFTSRRGEFKSANHFESTQDFLSEATKYQNGLSRLYKIQLPPSFFQQK